MLPKIIQEAKKAYEKLGIEPCQGAFYEPGAACLLGAIGLYRGVCSKKDNVMKRTNKLHKYFDYNHNLYYKGVIDGFDGNDWMSRNTPRGMDPKYQKGLRHGKMGKRMFLEDKV